MNIHNNKIAGMAASLQKHTSFKEMTLFYMVVVVGYIDPPNGHYFYTEIFAQSLCLLKNEFLKLVLFVSLKSSTVFQRNRNL